MSVIGKIRNVEGFIKEGELYLKKFGDDWYLSRRYLMGVKTKTIKLTSELSSVNFQSVTETSLSKTLLKTTLGGLSGLTWNSNRTISGGLIGLTSSIDTKSNNYYVELVFKDGRNLTGKTNHLVIQKLTTISPQQSENERLEIIESQKKHQRYLEDSPNTYYENRRDLEELKQELEKYQNLSKNGKTFDVRENSKTMIETINQKIVLKENLDKELSLRLKTIKKVGSYDDYLKNWEPLNKKQKRLIRRLKLNKFLVYSCLPSLLLTFFIPDEGIQSLIFMWFLGTLIYIIQYYLLKSLRQKSLDKVNKNIDDYDISNIIL